MYEVKEQCGHCARRCSSVKRCHDCATMVCSKCIAPEDECCLLCLETFQMSPGLSSAQEATTSLQALAAEPNPLASSNHSPTFMEVPQGAPTQQSQFSEDPTDPGEAFAGDIDTYMSAK